MEGARILILEDDPFEAEQLQLNLTERGYHVLAVVDNAKDCMEYIRGGEIDLLIIDIILEGEMDGIDVAEMIGRFYNMPFIYLTAHGTDELLTRAEQTRPVAYLLKPYRIKELDFMIRVGLERWKQEQRLQREKAKAEADLWQLATHDPLTQLPNRDLFINRLERAIRKARRANTHIGLLFIDLDHFKEINDSFGHFVGDQILQSVARHLEEHTRADDTVARLGGDEFTVIIDELDDLQNIGIFGQKLIDSFNKPFSAGKLQFTLNTSIGISLYPEDGTNPATLLRNADAAMYRAKAEGRSNFQFYTSDMTERARKRVQIESELQIALEQNQFVLHYQPQFNMETNRFEGAEALIRWQHPEKGLIQPLDFIPIAEKTGQIVAIGRWVLETVCTKLADWQQKGIQAGKIAINISQRQVTRLNFIDQIKETIQQTQCNPSQLELEITESLLIANPEQIAAELEQLRTLGCTIAIDDFGTGFSSLSYLKKFPINKLKIDRTFIKDLPKDINDSAITQAIIALGKNLDLEVIAEGVETEAQASFIKEHDCRYCQGFYFSKPLPEDAFLEFINNQSAGSVS